MISRPCLLLRCDRVSFTYRIWQVLEQLPHSLRREVLKNIYLRSMRRVPLFFGCDSALVSQIAEMLRRVVCLPGQIIVSQGV